MFSSTEAQFASKAAIRTHLGVGDLDGLFEDAGHAGVGRYTLDGNHEQVRNVFCRLSYVGDGKPSLPMMSTNNMVSEKQEPC
jgi:hypothetical protein